MLIRKADLDRIKTGEIKLAFRCWRQPTVKADGILNTAIGQLKIHAVQKTSVGKITAGDARAAGYSNRQALLDELEKREGDVYRIRLSYLGDDPRIQLRKTARLSTDDYAQLRTRLQRMDDRASCGPWTYAVLSIIRKRPQILAAMLADELGYEKMDFKVNVRKLKNLGLTISHGIGYSLSSRGAAVLERLQKEQRK